MKIRIHKPIRISLQCQGFDHCSPENDDFAVFQVRNLLSHGFFAAVSVLTKNSGVFFVVAFVLTFQGCFHVKTSVSMFVAHRSLGVFCFQGPKKWRTTGGDAEKSPLLKGLHHGSTKRDGSSPRLRVPGGGGWGRKKSGQSVFFFFER